MLYDFIHWDILLVLQLREKKYAIRFEDSFANYASDAFWKMKSK